MSAVTDGRANTLKWLGRLRLLDDLPLKAGEDKGAVELREMAGAVMQSFINSPSSMIIHVDGTWGRGKTSFCHILEGQLRAQTEREVTVEWYIASDDTSAPWGAVLSTLARALTEGDPEETKRILEMWGTGSDRIGDTLEDFRAFVARTLGHGYDRSVAPEPLRVQAEMFKVSEEAVDDENAPSGEGATAPEGLQVSDDDGATGWDIQRHHPEPRTVVVMVDDLDRCRPDFVVGVFDAIRAFVTCPGVKFVVAADRRILDAAAHRMVQRLDIAGTHRATDALQKYVRHRVELPLLSDIRDVATETERLEKILLGEDTSLLSGPRNLLGGVALLLAQTFGKSLTIRGLKRMLNAMAEPLARAADGAGLSPSHPSAEMLLSQTWHDMVQTAPSFEGPLFSGKPAGADDYPAFYLGILLRSTAEHFWPELCDGARDDGLSLEARFRALSSLAVAYEFWDHEVLDNVLDFLFPGPDGGPTTSNTVRRAYCDWVNRLYWSFKLHSIIPRGLEGTVMEESASAEPPDGISPEKPDQVRRSGLDQNVYEAELHRLLRFEDEPSLERDVRRLRAWLQQAPADADPQPVIDRLEAVGRWCSMNLDQFPWLYTPGEALDLGDALAQRGRPLPAFGFLGVLVEKAVAWGVWSVAGVVVLKLSDLAMRTAPGTGVEADMDRWAPFINTPGLMPLDEGLFARWTLRLLELVLQAELQVPQHHGERHARLCRAVFALAQSSRADDKMLGVLRNYVTSAIEDPNYAWAALADPELRDDPELLPRIIATSRSASVLEPVVVELRAELAAFLGASRNEPHYLTNALALLFSLRGTRGWTPRVVQNAASLTQRLGGGESDDAGRLYELAYRHGRQDDRRLRSVLSSLLHERSMANVADLVEQGAPLPEDIKPFKSSFDAAEIQPEINVNWLETEGGEDAR